MENSRILDQEALNPGQPRNIINNAGKPSENEITQYKIKNSLSTTLKSNPYFKPLKSFQIEINMNDLDSQTFTEPKILKNNSFEISSSSSQKLSIIFNESRSWKIEPILPTISKKPQSGVTKSISPKLSIPIKPEPILPVIPPPKNVLKKVLEIIPEFKEKKLKSPRKQLKFKHLPEKNSKLWEIELKKQIKLPHEENRNFNQIINKYVKDQMSTYNYDECYVSFGEAEKFYSLNKWNSIKNLTIYMPTGIPLTAALYKNSFDVFKKRIDQYFKTVQTLNMWQFYKERLVLVCSEELKLGKPGNGYDKSRKYIDKMMRQTELSIKSKVGLAREARRTCEHIKMQVEKIQEFIIC